MSADTYYHRLRTKYGARALLRPMTGRPYNASLRDAPLEAPVLTVVDEIHLAFSKPPAPTADPRIRDPRVMVDMISSEAACAMTWVRGVTSPGFVRGRYQHGMSGLPFPSILHAVSSHGGSAKEASGARANMLLALLGGEGDFPNNALGDLGFPKVPGAYADILPARLWEALSGPPASKDGDALAYELQQSAGQQSYTPMVEAWMAILQQVVECGALAANDLILRHALWPSVTVPVSGPRNGTMAPSFTIHRLEVHVRVTRLVQEGVGMSPPEHEVALHIHWFPTLAVPNTSLLQLAECYQAPANSTVMLANRNPWGDREDQDGRSLSQIVEDAITPPQGAERPPAEMGFKTTLTAGGSGVSDDADEIIGIEHVLHPCQWTGFDRDVFRRAVAAIIDGHLLDKAAQTLIASEGHS